MTANLRQAAGASMVVGLGGPELTSLERAWLKLICPAGIILFRRNILDSRQTRSLLAQASAFCAPHPLLCVDVEGGTVDRLRDVLAPMPSAHTVASAARNLNKPRIARQHAELIAREVKAFGFNTTLAPVLDLGLTQSASVMGTRCSGASPAEVVAYARQFFAGLAAQRVLGCAKHFPGLGGGTLDSHLETPSIQRAWTELWREDLDPYRALCRHIPMVMIDHAAYPRTAGKMRPASVSRFWIQTVLKQRIGYRGIVFSDDLEMGGVLKFMPIEEGAIEALRAGTDLIEICHTAELILRAFESLISEGKRSPAFHALLLRRARHSQRKRANSLTTRLSASLNAQQFDALRAQIIRFGAIVAAASSPQQAACP
jgi:beta-N-acetylhexosaminidase